MPRAEESTGYRHARLQGLVFEELRALLRDDIEDPTLTDVRVRAVVLSVDYRNARVHFSLQPTLRVSSEHPRRVLRALERATPFLRARLADAIDLKRTPDLRFVFDGTSPVDEAIALAPAPEPSRDDSSGG